MDFNEKTVIVIDHTADFAQHSSDEVVLETSTKTTQLRSTYRKSFWSNTVDAVLQYCRIVFDLFGAEKPISVVTFDREEKIHSIWLDEDQTLETLWTIFIHEGAPMETQPKNTVGHSLPGLDAGCSMLRMLKNSQKTDDLSKIENVGRVIVLSANMKNEVVSWIPSILKTLGDPPDLPTYSPVTASEWIFVDVTIMSSDQQRDSLITSPEKINLPLDLANLSHNFFYHQLSSSAIDLYRGMMRLVESHYHLASTLVQDIPMKEEANTSSGSAMYGVELIHSADAHKLLQLAGLADRLMVGTKSDKHDTTLQTTISKQPQQHLQRPNSGFSKTMVIKWITPKSSDSATLRYSNAAYRVTLADVGNRASTCLAQFVLGGRSVALAHRIPVNLPSLPDSIGQSVNATPDESLLLTCHGSVMYLHTLATVCPLVQSKFTHAPIDDMPKDLRVQSFIDQIVRPSRLAPASASQHLQVTPRERAQQHLERSTRYWPLFESYTLLGSNKTASPLFIYLPREFLESNEVNICKTTIDKLLDTIKHNVTLTDSLKSSTLKRPAVSLPAPVAVQAEAVALALELDHLLRLHDTISKEHHELTAHWQKCVGLQSRDGTKLFSASSLLERNFASLELSDQLIVSRVLLHTNSGELKTSIPDCVIKTIRGLKLLAKQLLESEGDMKYKFESANQSKNKSLVFESINLREFLSYFQQPAKRARPISRKKLEFCGVASADQKGFCQLYKNLKEKDKAVS